MEVTRILAVSDEVDEGLFGDKLRNLRPDLVLSCGDLPFNYLENLVSRADVPLLYVPGNHDPDVSPGDALWSPLRFEAAGPGPPGCDNVDGQVVDAAGLRIAGLGGSIRYREGPNQHSQGSMRHRALALELRCRARQAFDGRRIDVLLAHSPAAGLGDGGDPAHQGFAAFHQLLAAIRPRLFVHGHVHPYGVKAPDQQLGETLVINAVPFRLLEV